MTLASLRRVPVFAATSAITFLASGCTVLFDPDTKVCETNDDCAESVTGIAGLTCTDNLCVESVDGTFSCVGTERDVMANSAPWSFSVRYYNVSSMSDAIDSPADVRLCSVLDPSCTSPIDGPVETDADGAATVEGTQGDRSQTYVVAEADGYAPSISMMHRGSDLAAYSSEYALFREGEGAVLGSLAGVTVDENLGVIITTALSCSTTDPQTPEERSRYRAAGVSFRLDTVDRSTAQYYLRGGIGGTPSLSATDTDSSGNGGFFNAPIGFITVRAFVEGAEVGEAGVLTRPNTVTYVSLYPTRVLVPAQE